METCVRIPLYAVITSVLMRRFGSYVLTRPISIYITYNATLIQVISHDSHAKFPLHYISFATQFRMRAEGYIPIPNTKVPNDISAHL